MITYSSMEKKLVIRALLAFWQPAPTETHLFFTRGIGTHSITYWLELLFGIFLSQYFKISISTDGDGGVEDGQARPRPGYSKASKPSPFYLETCHATYFSPPAARIIHTVT